MFGWNLELSYWKRMFYFGKEINPSINNHNLLSTIFRIGKTYLGSLFCGVLSIVLIIILTSLAIFWTHKTKDLLLSFFPFLVLPFIISPWIHEAHYIILYPAIISIWFYIGERNRFNYYVLFILSYILLGSRYSFMNFPLFHSGMLGILTTGKLAGVIILFMLSGILAYEDKTKCA